MKTTKGFTALAAVCMLVAGMLSCKVETDYVDRTPPSPVTGLTLGYSSASKTLTANWHNPTDADFAGLVLSWKKEGGTGYNTEFEGIICTPSKTGSGAALTATFTGDTDGSDNWSYIKSIDPEGTAEAVVAENYPAFNWVAQYNTKYADKLNNKKFDWYMPSLVELCEVYKNRTAIDASLAKIHGLENGSGYADEKLENNMYWSSSQDSNYVYYAWLVGFSDGNVYFNFKFFRDSVCCLAGF